MRTNKEKYDHYYQIIKADEKAFVESTFPDPPKKLYSEQYGRLAEWAVTEVYYSGGIYQDDKPNREDVKRIKEHSESTTEMEKDRIWLHLSEVCEGRGSSCGINIDKVNVKHFTLKGDAQKIVDALALKKQKEDELLANGHTKCAYCSKVTKDSELVSKKIIFRTRNHYGKACVGEKTNKYCSSKCGSHDQMAHEG